MTSLTQQEWRRLLENLNDTAPGRVAEGLADARDIDINTAYDAVEAALEDGILVETEDGIFGSVRIPSDDNEASDSASEAEDDDLVSDSSEAESIPTPDGATPASAESWSDVEFATPETGVWAPAQQTFDQWMCREGGKNPYSPWTDADAPVECNHSDHDEPTTCDECNHHAGYKWGSEGSSEYVHGEHDTAREWAEMDPTLSSDLVFIQRESDPFAFVDGDDVRDPETGEVHPAFTAILEHLGVTYADISTSGAGIHAVYRGDIPLDGQGQAMFDLDDEPWGSNDDLPAIEIYADKHVCIATGDHLPGSGTEVAEWDADALRPILEAAGYSDKPDKPSAASDFDTDDHNPTATSSDELTDDIRDIYSAIDRLDAQRVADDTIVHQWNDDASTTGGNRAFVPTWGKGANGTANIVDEEIWQDTGGKGYGGPAVMAAIDSSETTATERAQPSDIDGEDWLAAINHLRDELGYSVPVWIPPADSSHHDTGKTPYWAVRKAALVLGIVTEDDLVERDGEDGGMYLGFPDAETYNATLEALEGRGITHGRESAQAGSDGKDYRTDPREVDVVLEPQRAWTAAGRVTPDQLDIPLSLATADDGEAWLTSSGDRVTDVARAVALDEGLVADVETPLTGEYAEAYQRARDHHGAPLPEYLTAADAVSRFDYVLGAVRELSYFHLDEDALTVHVTGRGEAVGGDAVRTLDPTPADGWRDSESGESVLVFESGTVWDADAGDDGAVIDTLRFVALDAGLIDDPTARLEGDTFTEAYQTARREYGAPLPRWNAGEPDVTPVLPSADELVETPDHVEEADIDDVRGEVETLYRELTRETDTAHVLRVLPALGKTTSAIKTAATRPTTYLAPRKELMQQAEHKASNHNVSCAHLPILSEENLPEGAVADAVSFVRERGMSELRNRWKLLSVVGGGLEEDDDQEDASVGDVEEVSLQRPTCPCAEGDHGEDWALAVHVARELDYTPRDIHERAEALFGTGLPCQEDGDCEYTAGWDRITNPDTPIDLLIGHYTHAHVEGARTHVERGSRGRVKRSPRTLVLDEYPGLTFAEQFDEDVKDHITWLASALDEGVEDFQDLMERDLWNNKFVQSWLDGSADEDGAPAGNIVSSLAAREDAHAAVEQAEMFLDEYPDLFEDHDLADPLRQLINDYPDITANERRSIAGTIQTTVANVPADAGGFNILQWCDDDVASPLAASASEDLTVDLDDVPGGGELVSLVERALEAADEGEDGATGILQGAQAALTGGDLGARELAVWANDGYAHREAHYLLEAALAPDDGRSTARIATDEFTFGEEEATLKRADVGPEGDSATVLLDRDYNGAEVLSPPDRHAAGETCPLIGLDATGRRELWELALGEDVTIADVHETDIERAEALRNLHNLQVVQTTDLIKSYEGDPDGKNLDADVALLEEIADKYAGVHAARGRDEENTTLGKPAAITTKVVRSVLEDDEQAAAATSAWENYGNLKGSNDLGHHQLGALLGCQHYGDHAVERMAAFAGEEIERNGYGTALDYGGEVANEYLGHMREDQVMQAVLRFARGESGAVVFAHTAALRSDLPVVGEGQVIKSWSPTARKIADEWRRHPDEEFTISDVSDAVDVGRRQVRRVLNEFADAGYLERHDPGEGLANEYTPMDQPGAGETELDDVAPDLESGAGQNSLEVTYTTNVRVSGVKNSTLPRTTRSGSTLPAPSEHSGLAPPG